MPDYVTAIGLDVHARSIKAFALNPMTGECERASFGYDPAAVAEWALSFEAPRAVYESGVTGFHLCRALRALGLAARRRPGQEDRQARRGVPRAPARHAQRRRGLGARRAHRGRPRPVARPRRRPRRPAARQAEDVEVPAEARPRVRRGDPDRPQEGQLDARVLEVGGRDLLRRARRRGRIRALPRLREALRGGPRRARAQGRRGGGATRVEARLRRAEVREGHRRRHRLPARLRGGRLLQVPHGPGVRLVVRARPLGALERRGDVEGRDHARGQRPRAHGPRRGGLARADVVARPEAARARPGGGARGEEARGEVQPQAPGPQGGDGRRRQAARRRQLRHGARDGVLGVGDREDGVRVAPRGQGPTPGPAAVRGRWEATRVLFLGSGEDRHARHKTSAEAPSRSNEMRSRRGHARILECRTCVEQTRPQAAGSPGEDR